MRIRCFAWACGKQLQAGQMSILKGMWGDLKEPDDFESDWYGELTNQLSHTLCGLVLTTIVCMAYSLVFGEMPYRWALITLIPAYAIFVEWRHGWTRGDSWFDVVMWGFGVATPTLSFEEVETVGGRFGLMPSEEIILTLTALWAAALYFRVRRRYVAAIALETTGNPSFTGRPRDYKKDQRANKGKNDGWLGSSGDFGAPGDSGNPDNHLVDRETEGEGK